MIHSVEIVLVLLSLLVLLLAIRAEEKKTWRKVNVSEKGRGGNADKWYWVSPAHKGRELWMTDENVVQCKVRASGLRDHPHKYYN